jgi:hypothetical protein
MAGHYEATGASSGGGVILLLWDKDFYLIRVRIQLKRACRFYYVAFYIYCHVRLSSLLICILPPLATEVHILR